MNKIITEVNPLPEYTNIIFSLLSKNWTHHIRKSKLWDIWTP